VLSMTEPIKLVYEISKELLTIMMFKRKAKKASSSRRDNKNISRSNLFYKQ
jgi:hypothetical protein